MGGHGAFIWSSYAIVAVVTLGLLLISLKTMRARERELAELQQSTTVRRGAGSGATPHDA
jgi:heme exporter protein D